MEGYVPLYLRQRFPTIYLEDCQERSGQTRGSQYFQISEFGPKLDIASFPMAVMSDKRSQRRLSHTDL